MTVIKGDILAGLPANRGPVAHCVVVAWEATQVVAQVQFFSRFRYRIVLADGGFVDPGEGGERKAAVPVEI